MEEDIKNDLAAIAFTHPFFNEIVENTLNYIKQLEEENKELKEAYKSEKTMKNNYVRYYQDLLLKENSIPKSKVKENLKQLEKEYKQDLENNSINAFILKCKIEAIKELLGEE